MVGPKMQDFSQGIDMLKGNCFKTILQSCDKLCEKVPELYIQSQFSMSKNDAIFSKKHSF
jgi:hypothetical protein